MKTRVCVLCVGSDEDRHTHAEGMLLSLLAQSPREALDIVIGTDEPSRFERFKEIAETRRIAPETFQGWTGTDGFFGRAKIVGFGELARGAGGSILYLDTDLVCRRRIDDLLQSLNDGKFVLHLNEGRILERTKGAHARLYSLARGKQFGRARVDECSSMWNSGVIGLPAGSAGIIDEALVAYDEMLAAGASFHFVEQFAFGILMEQCGEVVEAEPWFLHYWGNKPGFSARLGPMLAEIDRQGFDLDRAVEHVRRRQAEGWLDLPSKAPKRRWYQQLFA